MNIREAIAILQPENKDDLKAAYRRACLKYHPDHGGDEEIMKLVNAAYETLKTATWSQYDKRQAANDVNIADELLKKWNEIKTWKTIKGEVCGSWLWVSGETWRYKKQLKEMSFRWSRNKTAWYWHNSGYRKKGKKVFSMDEIRHKYGSNGLRNENLRELA